MVKVRNKQGLTLVEFLFATVLIALAIIVFSNFLITVSLDSMKVANTIKNERVLENVIFDITDSVHTGTCKEVAGLYSAVEIQAGANTFGVDSQNNLYELGNGNTKHVLLTLVSNAMHPNGFSSPSSIGTPVSSLTYSLNLTSLMIYNGTVFNNKNVYANRLQAPCAVVFLDSSESVTNVLVAMSTQTGSIQYQFNNGGWQTYSVPFVVPLSQISAGMVLCRSVGTDLSGNTVYSDIKTVVRQ